MGPWFQFQIAKLGFALTQTEGHICNDFELNAPHIIVDGASVCLFYILVVGKWLHICDLELFGKGMCSAAAGYPDLESNSASYIWGVHNI